MRITLVTNNQAKDCLVEPILGRTRLRYGFFTLLAATIVLQIIWRQTNIVAQDLPQNQRVSRFDDHLVRFLGIVSNKNTAVPNKQEDAYILALPCRANTSEHPRYYQFSITVPNSLERSVLEDASDGKWQNWDIVSSALVAEGLTDSQKVNYYSSKVRAAAESLRPKLKTVPREQWAKIVFEGLHKLLLIGKYDMACTDLVQSLESGDFNCVSATVLFHAMARQAGLDVCGVEMQGHALSRIRVGQQTIDLETTCVEWFNLSPQARLRSQQAVITPTNNKSQQTSQTTLQQSFLPTSFASSDAERAPTFSANRVNVANVVPQKPREVSDVQLIATIYYNKGVDELTAEKFNSAIIANLKALQLDPQNENAWKNLLATLNNWAIACAVQGRYIDAAQLLDEGRLIDPNYELFRSNQVHTYYHWIKTTAEQRDYATVAKLFRLAEDRLPNQPNLRYLNYVILRKTANEFFAARNLQKAFEQYDAAAKIVPPGVNVAEAEILDVTYHVEDLFAQSQFDDAVRLIDRELSRHPVSPDSSNGSPNLPIEQATFVQPLTESTTLYTTSRPIQNPATQNPTPQNDPYVPFTTPIVLQAENEASDNSQIVVQPSPHKQQSSLADLLERLVSLRRQAMKNPGR
ncbi:MAG: tetratricopeptide repeat protein [Planctomycetaceae bacterium]|jgi:tetratricopeptide (TPR) repeat protein|nr:tetratricopeptide repeat protein [Planctomycetaceae bacterium]